jgi:AcrR family transcriptional regulator
MLTFDRTTVKPPRSRADRRRGGADRHVGARPSVLETKLKNLTGRRERNKADKLRRIKLAARRVFLAHGYDSATTREIAQRAKVAIGTLFLYATDKRDLLFLVVNDDYIAVAERAAAGIRPGRRLLENLVAVFRPLYQFFAADPELSRFVLREMLFYETGPQALRFTKARDRMLEISTGAIRMAEDAGQIRRSKATHLVGRLVFSVYQVEVRRWLAGENLDVGDGIDQLRQALTIVIEGLSPVLPVVSDTKRKRVKRQR